MKTIDIIAAILLVIGGLNWGLIGLFDFNLVSSLFGATPIERIVYIVVGLAAVWQVVQWKAIQSRWS
ncbi:MAG: DUF378 domain-containing protein [Chlamydiia bacterium]|nr:DUF378 domain-containing protein [Chlamydiia bacterium]